VKTTVRGATTFWVFAIPAAALVAVTAVFMLTGMGGPSFLRDVDDISQGLAAALGSAAALLAAKRHQGRSRWGWAIMSVGLGMWAAGQAVWCRYEIGQGRNAPFPSLADVGYLSFSVCASVAVWFISDHDPVPRRVRAIIDGLVVAGSLLVISWCTALGATVRAGGGVSLSALVALAYPLTDIVLLTMTVQILARVSGRRSSLIALGAATIALAVSDSSFVYLTALGRYHTGDALDLGWIGGFGLLTVAAATARRPSGATRRGNTPQLVVLPYAVLAVAAAVLGSLILEGHRVHTVEGVAIAVVVLLVFLRQYLTVRENQKLLSTVEAREAQLTYQAFHDPLTGLPNRALFNDRVAHALALHQRSARPLAVLFCDLDDFKVINDTLGHRAGDNLLVRVTERLRHALRPGDTLARLGGDEFAILVEDADPVNLGQRIVALLEEPFTLEGRPMTVQASIGISTVSGEEATPAAAVVLANADMAMYAVKRTGKSHALVYNDSMRRNGLDDLHLHQALTEALAVGAVRAVYQPIVDPLTGRVLALETFARWERDGVPVEPLVFVPLAERLGVVHMLTDGMLEAAVGQLEQWSEMLGHHELRVCVSISPSDLDVRGHLVDRVVDALARHTVRSDQLVLEVPESAAGLEPEIAAQTFRHLRDLGVHIALDDFGTGHSSLSRLQEFPIDYLKLDGSMIRSIDGDETQSLVVRSILDLASSLDLTVVAEGVETMAQLQSLQAAGTPPLLQGYHLVPPLPAADLTQFLVVGLNVPEVLAVV
jgi:diguanylate cyclase (GGDEF)-like protein